MPSRSSSCACGSAKEEPTELPSCSGGVCKPARRFASAGPTAPDSHINQMHTWPHGSAGREAGIAKPASLSAYCKSNMVQHRQLSCPGPACCTPLASIICSNHDRRVWLEWGVTWHEWDQAHLLAVHLPPDRAPRRQDPGRSLRRGCRDFPICHSWAEPQKGANSGHARCSGFGNHGQNSSIAMASFGLWLGAWLVVGLGLLSALPCCVRAVGLGMQGVCSPCLPEAIAAGLDPRTTFRFDQPCRNMLWRLRRSSWRSPAWRWVA